MKNTRNTYQDQIKREMRAEAKRQAPAKKKKAKRLKKRRKPSDRFYLSKAWRSLRYEALQAFGRQCLCCGRTPPTVALHVDHILPRSEFPELELDINNIQVLCEDCNLGKSNKDYTDFRI